MQKRERNLSGEIQTAQQEMRSLRDAWSFVPASDGSLRALKTTTITAPARPTKINLFNYMGERGLDMYSITEEPSPMGTTYLHVSYMRELGFLGSRATLDMQAVNARAIVRRRQTAHYVFPRAIFLLDPHQVVKIVSKDTEPIALSGNTERLAAIAFSAPQEYADIYTVQRVMDAEAQAEERVKGAREHRVDFPTAVCSVTSYTDIPSWSVM